jgi:hypothetical protein
MNIDTDPRDFDRCRQPLDYVAENRRAREHDPHPRSRKDFWRATFDGLIRVIFWGGVGVLIAFAYLYFFGPWVNDLLVEMSW